MEIEIIREPDPPPAQVASWRWPPRATVSVRSGTRTTRPTGIFFVTLVPAALATKKILLGILAVSPSELHPLKMANSILSLNELSKGRAILAVGGGGQC